MFKELDVVALTSEIPFACIYDVPPGSPLHCGEHRGGLRSGDVGTIVHVQGNGEAFVVEFLEQGGYTVALADVLASQVRSATREDIANDRFRRKARV